MDVEKTPCARDALIHGIAGSLVVGALYFMKSGEAQPLDLRELSKHSEFLCVCVCLCVRACVGVGVQVSSGGHVTLQWVDLLSRPSLAGEHQSL